jgi:MFS transporter, PAT family, beta-lactamase induction signal transducer AmpG
MRLPLSQNPTWRYAIFGAMNLSQGLLCGLVFTSYFFLLTDLKLTPVQVGAAVAWARLPWALKLLWGPILDRYVGGAQGRRRPFILAGQFLLGAFVLALAVVPKDAEWLGVIATLVFLASASATLQNVALNGLCVDLVAQNQLGRTNAVIWATKSVGVAIGGGALYAGTAYLPWSVLLTALALVIWALTVVPLMVRERAPGEVSEHGSRRLELAELRRTFVIPRVWMALLAAFLIPLGYGLLSTPYQFLLRDHLQWSKEAIGFLTGVLDPLVGVAGSLTGGFLTDRFGARRILVFASFGMAVTMAALALCPDAWSSQGAMFTWYGVHFIVQYLFGAGMLAFFMSLSNPAIGATHIGIYFSLNNLCYTFCDWGGGSLLTRLSAELSGSTVPTIDGYVYTFALCAVIQVVVMVPLIWCDPQRIRARFLALPKGGPA